MIPQTIGREYDIGKVVRVQCVENDILNELDIKNNCFLMIIMYKGYATFRVGDITFNANSPCIVCFDETESPQIVKKRGVKCDSVYFHPTFLNVNLTFEFIHSNEYANMALKHDLFMLKPFTDERQYVLPIFDYSLDNVRRLFNGLKNELICQSDWYWSCRSRSYYIEMILMLERTYMLINQPSKESVSNTIENPHLKSAIIFIENHYHEDITLDDIKTAASFNVTSLTEKFKQKFGLTPIEYLWDYRISIAKKQLEFTNLPTKDIAKRCGFKTIQHFSRKFEEATQMSPVAFRTEAVKRRKNEL